MGLGLVEDFATWTEKTRRKLLREGNDEEKRICDLLPPGVPVSVPDAVEFIDTLLSANPPKSIAERASKWRDKLCRIPHSKRDPSSPG